MLSFFHAHGTGLLKVWEVVYFFVSFFLFNLTFARIAFAIQLNTYLIPIQALYDTILFVNMLIMAHTVHEDEEFYTKRYVRYLKGNFLVDFIAFLPLELVMRLFGQYHYEYTISKLLVIFNMKSIYLKWRRRLSISLPMIRIVESFGIIHWLANLIGCIFFFIIRIQGSPVNEAFTGTADLLNRPLSSQYARSFYWAFVTMTGYNNTTPSTLLETFFAFVVTMIGIVLFATTIGNVGSLILNLDSAKIYYTEKLDMINDYMSYNNIPEELQREVHLYYEYLWYSGKCLDSQRVFNTLPPSIKKRLNFCLNTSIIHKVPFFRECMGHQEFITSIVQSLKSRVYIPNSFITYFDEPGSEMYFICRGELNIINEYEEITRTLMEGDFYGDFELLYDLKWTEAVVSRTYCDILVLTRAEFRKILRRYPEILKCMKDTAYRQYVSNTGSYQLHAI